jgi:nicotinamidase-related amidase
MADDLVFGPLGANCMHLCIDMQRMFAEETDWQTPWMPRVAPNVVRLTEIAPERSVFTRFIPAQTPDDSHGTWKRYYERWRSMTLDTLDPEMTGLMPELDRFVPPARVLDKKVYSPWIETDLHQSLAKQGVDTLIITGCETEMCVLAAVMGAIDLGYRIILPTDALCSSADETHDAMIGIYRSRYGMQVETVDTDRVLEAWDPKAEGKAA